VHCTVWLKLGQLERGAKVKVRTPSGKKVLVTVPAHTKIGSVLRLPGMGMASGSLQGDQYVHIEAVT
jgi:DnaJ-class molecular chaperone